MSSITSASPSPQLNMNTPSLLAPVGTTLVSYHYTPPRLPDGREDPGAPPRPARAGTCYVYAQPPAELEAMRIPNYAHVLTQAPKQLLPRPPEPLAPSLGTRLWQGLKLAAMGVGAVGVGILAGHAGSALAGGVGLAAVGLGSTLGFAALVQLKNALFGLRHDGVEIRDATLMRRIMPMLLRTRQEASVVHEQVLDLHKAMPFIEAWNQTHAHKISVFHLILASICRSADIRPGLDRFVAGGRLFQRTDPSLSFVVKREFKDYSGLRTVKFRAQPYEGLESLVAGMQESIHVERKERGLRPVEKETRFFVELPTWLPVRGPLRAALPRPPRPAAACGHPPGSALHQHLRGQPGQPRARPGITPSVRLWDSEPVLRGGQGARRMEGGAAQGGGARPRGRGMRPDPGRCRCSGPSMNASTMATTAPRPCRRWASW